MEKTAAIVLAAGSASRMGQPKQLLKIGSQSLVQRAVQTALSATCHPVVVVTGAYANEVQQSVRGLSVTCVHNTVWKEGMGSSIRCGVSTAVDISPATEAIIILLCDQPLVSPYLLQQLIATYRSTQQPLVASAYGDTRGVPALFHRSLFPALLNVSGATGARKLIRQYQEGVATVSFPEGMYDVDTPEDYEKMKKMHNLSSGQA